MLKITPPEAAATQDPTKNYADALWRQNPKLSPNAWRLVAGRTVGKIAGRVASPFCQAQAPHIADALNNGINLWFISITDFTALKTFTEALNSTQIPRDALTLIYDYPLSAANQLEAELELLPAPNGISFTSPETPTENELLAAFTAAETAIKQGKMHFYGLTLAGLAAPEDTPQHLNLATVIDAANTGAKAAYGRRKRSMIRTLNTPLNLLELGALRHAAHTAEEIGGTQTKVSLLELAARANIAVTAERPLTAHLPNSPDPIWLIDNAQTSPLRQELLTRLQPAKNTYWANTLTPLENMALNLITSLPAVTAATVMPGLDYGNPDLQTNTKNPLPEILTPLLEQPDFADPAPLVGVRG